MKINTMLAIFITFFFNSQIVLGNDIIFNGVYTPSSWQHHIFNLPEDSTISVKHTSDCINFVFRIDNFADLGGHPDSDVWMGPYPIGKGERKLNFVCYAYAPSNEYTITINIQTSSIGPVSESEPNNYPSQATPLSDVTEEITGLLGFWINPGGKDTGDYYSGFFEQGFYLISLWSDSLLYKNANLNIFIQTEYGIPSLFSEENLTPGLFGYLGEFYVEEDGEYLIRIGIASYELLTHGSYTIHIRPKDMVDIIDFQYPENTVCGLTEDFSVTLKNYGDLEDHVKVEIVISGLKKDVFEGELFHVIHPNQTIKFVFTWEIESNLGTGKYTIDLRVKSTMHGTMIRWADFGLLCRRNSLMHLLLLLD